MPTPTIPRVSGDRAARHVATVRLLARGAMRSLPARAVGLAALLVGARWLAERHYLRRLVTGRVNSDIYLEDFATRWELLPFDVLAYGFSWAYAIPLGLSLSLAAAGPLRGGGAWIATAGGALLYFLWAAELALFLG